MWLTVCEILEGFVDILLMQTNVNHMLAYLNALRWQYSHMIEIDYILPVEQEIICKAPLLTSLLEIPPQTEVALIAVTKKNRKLSNSFWGDAFWTLWSLNFLSVGLLIFYIIAHEF